MLIYVTNTKMMEDLHHAVKRHPKRCEASLHVEFLLGVSDGPSVPFREPASLLHAQNNYATVLSVAAHVDDLSMLVDDHRPAGLHSLGTADEAAGSRSRSIVPKAQQTGLLSHADAVTTREWWEGDRFLQRWDALTNGIAEPLLVGGGPAEPWMDPGSVRLA